MPRSRENVFLADLSPEFPGSVRGALRALFGRISGDAMLAPGLAPGADPAPGPAVQPLATPCENRRQLLRANARAAHDSVQGTPEAALDAALSVVEAAWLEACAERNAYAEALKAIRMYSEDAKVRGIASQTLTPCAKGHATATPRSRPSYDA